VEVRQEDTERKKDDITFLILGSILVMRQRNGNRILLWSIRDSNNEDLFNRNCAEIGGIGDCFLN